MRRNLNWRRAPHSRRVKWFSLLSAEAKGARLKELAPANLLFFLDLDDWLIQPLITHIHVRLEHLFTTYHHISHNRHQYTSTSGKVNSFFAIPDDHAVKGNTNTLTRSQLNGFHETLTGAREKTTTAPCATSDRAVGN